MPCRAEEESLARRQGAGAGGKGRSLLGRPHVYGLAIAGEEGVREVIRNVVAEFDLTLAMCGLTKASDLGPECLVPA